MLMCFPSMYIMYTPRSYQVWQLAIVWSDTGMMVRLYHIFLATSWYSSVILFVMVWYRLSTVSYLMSDLIHFWLPKMYDSYLTSDLTTHLIQFPTPRCVHVQVCAMVHVHVHGIFVWWLQCITESPVRNYIFDTTHSPIFLHVSCIPIMGIIV